MNKRTVFALLKKEILNIIRDKRSFITMILLPVLMYPIMIGIVGGISALFTKVDDTIKYGVNYTPSEDFINYLNEYNEDVEIEYIYASDEELKEKFDNGDINIYVIKKENDYELHYDDASTTGVATVQVIREIYDTYSEKHFKDELALLNVDYDELKNTFNIIDVQESITEMGSFVPSIISMSIILIVFSNCFSSAVEVSTNEKEKGTLETLLSLPISKKELIVSKFLTVLMITFISGVLSFLSLFTTLYFAKDAMSLFGFVGFSIKTSTLIIYFLSILLLSVLFTGLVLCFTIFSKTLKEAQNSLMPLELVVTFISYLPLLGINASIKSSLIPFVNISLLLNNSLSTNIDGMFVLITIVSSFIYAYLLILLVSSVYNQEDILFNTKSLKNISFKSGKGKMLYYSPLSSIVLAVIIYVLALYLQLMLITKSVWILLAIMPMTIALVSVVSGLLCNYDFKNGFKLNKFKILDFIKLLLLFISTVIISNAVVNVIAGLFPSTIEKYEMLLGIIDVDNIYLELLIVAILPGIFEEVLFRGIIYNSFEHRYNPLIGILASSIFFGIYHMNWIQGINAFIMGIALAYSYYKTHSLFVPILFHIFNNSFSVISEHFMSDAFLNNMYISILLLVFAVIVICIFLFKSRNYSKEE